MTAEALERPALIRRGKLLEYATVGYNSLEGLIAIGAGWLAGSVALVGFGFDSVIEVISGVTLLWRLYADVNDEQRERVEQRALRRRLVVPAARRVRRLRRREVPVSPRSYRGRLRSLSDVSCLTRTDDSSHTTDGARS